MNGYNLRNMCLLIVSVMLGCATEPAPQTITLATTTSVQDSGLLDVLLPRFQEQTGIHVKVVAVGSGQALQLGRRGDADVLLAHSPEAEDEFMAQGEGADRRAVMYNDFVLLGPPDDPAAVKGKKHLAEALAEIAQKRAPFVSRGDQSGTHQKEEGLWKHAGIRPEGGWYIQAGAGMGQAMRMAGQMRAYTLCDRATFLANPQAPELSILVEGDAALRNQYSVILVNPQKHPHVHEEPARRFVKYLLAPDTQRIIAEFGIQQFGQPLFFPNAARY